MKKRKMTRQGVFFFWSLILMLAGIAAVYKEYTAEWRGYQKEFRHLTVKLAEEEITTENAKIQTMYEQKLDDLAQKIQASTDATRSVNQQELIRKQEELIKKLEHEEYERRLQDLRR